MEKTAEQMARNFVKKYSQEKLCVLISQFKSRKSNELIAKEFGVTRQRVHQWYCAFVDVNILEKPFLAKYISR